MSAADPRGARLKRIDALYAALGRRLGEAKALGDLGAIVRFRQAMRRVEVLRPFYRGRVLP